MIIRTSSFYEIIYVFTLISELLIKVFFLRIILNFFLFLFSFFTIRLHSDPLLEQLKCLPAGPTNICYRKILNIGTYMSEQTV